MKNYLALIRMALLLPVLHLLLVMGLGIAGFIKFGEIPSYGIHPDPHSIGLSWINGIAILVWVLSFLILPIVLFVITDSLLKREKVWRGIIVHLTLAFAAIILFFCFRKWSGMMPSGCGDPNNVLTLKHPFKSNIAASM